MPNFFAFLSKITSLKFFLSFEIVEPILQHAIDQLRGDSTKVKSVHNDQRFLKSNKQTNEFQLNINPYL